MATDDEIKKKAKMNKEIQSNVPLKSPQEFMEKLWYALDHFNWGDSALDASSIKFLNESQIFFEQALRLKESAARVDERAIYESQSREQIHQAERRAAKAERQRCIEILKPLEKALSKLEQAQKDWELNFKYDTENVLRNRAIIDVINQSKAIAEIFSKSGDKI